MHIEKFFIFPQKVSAPVYTPMHEEKTPERSNELDETVEESGFDKRINT